MNNSLSTRNAFKFVLQEEKLNTLRRLTTQRKTSDMIESEKEQFKQETVLDFNNEYLKSLIGTFKEEITTLKSYINRLNSHIRQKLNMEMPHMEDEEYKAEASVAVKFLNECLNRMINMEYLNPLLLSYDKYTSDLEAELKHYKGLCSKYDSRISGLVQENNSLREKLIVKENELREILKIPNDPNSNAILNTEFLSTLEERNNLLSKENEVLAMNYQQVSKQLLDFSLNHNEKVKESIEKINHYDKLYEDYQNLLAITEQSTLKNKHNEARIFDLSNYISRMEIDLENMKNDLIVLKNENKSLHEGNLFYKNFINKLNN